MGDTSKRRIARSKITLPPPNDYITQYTTCNEIHVCSAYAQYFHNFIVYIHHNIVAMFVTCFVQLELSRA